MIAKAADLIDHLQVALAHLGVEWHPVGTALAGRRGGDAASMARFTRRRITPFRFGLTAMAFVGLGFLVHPLGGHRMA